MGGKGGQKTVGMNVIKLRWLPAEQAKRLRKTGIGIKRGLGWPTNQIPFERSSQNVPISKTKAL